MSKSEGRPQRIDNTADTNGANLIRVQNRSVLFRQTCHSDTLYNVRPFTYQLQLVCIQGQRAAKLTQEVAAVPDMTTCLALTQIPKILLIQTGNTSLAERLRNWIPILLAKIFNLGRGIPFHVLIVYTFHMVWKQIPAFQIPIRTRNRHFAASVAAL